MTTWENAHRRAAVMAAEIHADLGVDFTKPVDPFSAIEELEIVLAFGRLGRGVSGMYLPAGNGQPTAGIIIHAGHPRTRQRYSAAHELGHHAFDHAPEADGDLEVLRRREQGWSDEEKEAEAFGAWFLMPRRLVRVGLKALGIDHPRDPLDVYALSLWLGTSYTATALHLSTIRLVDRSTADRWAEVKPRDIKTMIAGEMVPDTMRNDVWWVDTRRASHPLSARAGDRVIVTVEELPSSGYAWRVTETGSPAVPLLADSFFDDWEPELTGQTDDGELAGGVYPRSFALGITDDVGPGEHVVHLVRDRSFDPGPAVERLDLSVSVDSRRFGLQVAEPKLALS